MAGRGASGRSGCGACGTHLVVDIPGMESPLSVTETNNFGADDIPVGASVRLAYDPDALVALGE